MKRAAFIGAVMALSSGTAWCQDRPEESQPQPLVCVPPAETRALFFEKKLVPPFRVMREAAIVSQAEAIEIQLCWFKGALGYDVTRLSREGGGVHRLFAGARGAPLGGHDKP